MEKVPAATPFPPMCEGPRWSIVWYSWVSPTINFSIFTTIFRLSLYENMEALEVEFPTKGNNAAKRSVFVDYGSLNHKPIDPLVRSKQTAFGNPLLARGYGIWARTYGSLCHFWLYNISPDLSLSIVYLHFCFQPLHSMRWVLIWEAPPQPFWF